MKYFIIGLIKLYQWTPLSSHRMCRFYPTCSNYMIDALNEHGTIMGLYLGIKRILKCRPGGPSGIDLVPRKKEKNEKDI